MGTGRNEFIELTKNTIIKIETGPQGGSHLWISVRTRALGTSALLEFGVNDGQTGELLTWEGLKLVMPLNQGPEGGEAHGLSAFLNEKDPAKNAGKTVVLWATATGDCHPPMHSESPPIVLQ